MNSKGTIGMGGMIVIGVLGILMLAGMTTCGMVVSTYNNVQVQGTRVDAAASEIKVQLKRRLDLLPNLMAVVQGYATHERTTFTEIANARAKLGGVINATGSNMQQLAQASQTLGGTIGRLLMLQENYPQLQANQNFRDLQSQVEGTENRITVARTDYNSLVQTYNAYIKVFPNNVIANFIGAHQREFFSVDSATVENPPALHFNAGPSDTTH